VKVFVVHAHPEPRSFCAALRDVAVAESTALGHEVRVSDLYVMGFQPVSDRRDFLTVADPDYLKPQREQLHALKNDGLAPDVAAELDNLFWCDLAIFTFPLWWFSVPAILKGFFDRVLVMGKIYGGGKVYETGGLAGRRAMLALTTGGPAPAYAPGGRNGAMMSLLYPVHHGVLWFSGMQVLPPFVAYGPAHLGDGERAALLDDFRARLRALPDAAPIGFDLPGF
jgi:NAD(P)H dehydrogenase (quinone)